MLAKAWISAEAVAGTLIGAAFGVGLYQVNKALDHDIPNSVVFSDNTEAKQKEKGYPGAPQELQNGIFWEI